VVQLVEAMRYKSEVRGFDSRSSLEFFINKILSAALWLWGWLSTLTNMSTRIISWGVKRPVHRTDNLTTLIC